MSRVHLAVAAILGSFISRPLSLSQNTANTSRTRPSPSSHSRGNSDATLGARWLVRLWVRGIPATLVSVGNIQCLSSI